MESIANLDFEKIANAIVILITGLAVGLGFRQGKKTTTSEPAAAQVEVAGALVDSSSVRALAGELAGQSLAINAQTAATKAQTEELEEVRHSVNRLREALDRLSVEIARRR